MTKIVFLCSGGGGSFVEIYKWVNTSQSSFSVEGVIVDRDCPAMSRARELKVPTYMVDLAIGWGHLKRCILSVDADVVVTTISRILPVEILDLNVKFINLHYSILPAYAGYIGMKPVKTGRKMGRVLLGATCHQVVEEVDAGLVLSQAAVKSSDLEADDIQLVFDIAWRVLANGLHRVMNQSEVFSGVVIINQKPVLFS